VVVRHGELVPADARLVQGQGWIDYSFVTGESAPVSRAGGDLLYAGGQQMGGRIEIETVKPVSQSYLTGLWDDQAFRKPREADSNTLTNRYSRRFTVLIMGVAVLAAVAWIAAGDPSRGLRAMVSVLIVACPCALALAAPFALGTAQRWLARADMFLRNGHVLESLACTDTIVFDKTGTLTSARTQEVAFRGEALMPEERDGIAALARHSAHPLARSLGEALLAGATTLEILGFLETPGCGIQGTWHGSELRLGSRGFLEDHGVRGMPTDAALGGSVWLAINGRFRGVFSLSGQLRQASDRLLQRLGARHELVLLSGDHDGERERFQALFGSQARLRFNQSPQDKLGFIRDLQSAGRKVVMVGDGLNDAGALRQSEVGVAVVEQVGIFSPASDVILPADRVPELAELLALARQTVKIVRLSFGISAAYNVVGVSIAAAGVLSPLLCAVLMPLSSVSVVLFACGATTRAVRRCGPKLDLRHGLTSDRASG
jgi:Cu+-exporting ATPase